MTWRNNSVLSLGGGALGLALACLGEAAAARQQGSRGSLILYLSGILIFAVSAWRSPSPAEDLLVDEASPPHNRWLRWAALGFGAAVASWLGVAAGRLIYKEDLHSSAGLRLWLASLAILAATGLVAARGSGWPARWSSRPASSQGRWLPGSAVLLLLVVAVAARLVALKTIPYGVNPDEGDRAVFSIEIARGQSHRSIFEDGWYQLSMVYFWLMAQLMKVIGIGYVQARIFSALASIVSVAAVTWIGIRQFNRRVGLLAGSLLSLMCVSLFFARFTSEASSTAALWAVSVALLLEAARRGKDWAWIGAGLAGGFSVYFYPTGRLWAVLAASFCVYLLAHGLGRHRRDIVRGAALAALAAMLTATPFFVLGLRRPAVLWVRASETSILAGDNVRRLSYYRPEWSTARLIFEQTDRSIGLFNRFADRSGYWPTGRPIMGHALAALTLLGLGWSCLNWRDPRFVLLALWFWIGFVGVILTIDTPNLHRMAAAVPVLALFPALVLESLARRAEVLVAARRAGALRATQRATSVVVALAAAYLMWHEGRFYFGDYARMDSWPAARIEADAVRAQGTHALVTSLGRSSHMAISGLLRLMAPEASLAGILSPGSDLPLAVPAHSGLAFVIYANRPAYLAYLQEVYPGGTPRPWYQPDGRLVVTTYRLSRQQWSATQGALAWPPGEGAPVRVDSIGSAPAGLKNYPSAMRWTAGLRVPRYWNYAFRIGPGPARLTVDGIPVLSIRAGAPVEATAVALARGEHAIEYEGVLTAEDPRPRFEWAILPATASGDLEWHPVRTDELTSTVTGAAGLFGIVRVAGQPEQRRLDATLATCCLSRQVTWSDSPYTAAWAGTLRAPTSGLYSMDLFAQGAADLTIDRQNIIHTDSPRDEPTKSSVTLAAGSHSVELVFRVNGGPGGLEWIWTPPGGVASVVPPSALSPPPGAAIGPVVPTSVLGGFEMQPVHSPFLTVP